MKLNLNLCQLKTHLNAIKTKHLNKLIFGKLLKFAINFPSKYAVEVKRQGS